MSGEESTPPQQYDAILYFDGASRGNPGPARFGAVLCDATTGNRLAVTAGALENGDGTNNEAEYTALIRGLELAREHGVRRLLVRGDSLLVVRQVNGEWRIKKDTLRALAQRARDLAVSFEQIRITWIPREENAEADALANEQFETGKMCVCVCCCRPSTSTTTLLTCFFTGRSIMWCGKATQGASSTPIGQRCSSTPSATAAYNTKDSITSRKRYHFGTKKLSREVSLSQQHPL